MTNPTLERAARALQEAANEAMQVENPPAFDDLPHADKMLARNLARAVLMAVRRVPNDICEIGAAAVCANSDIEAGWSAMIDAILKDGEGE